VGAIVTDDVHFGILAVVRAHQVDERPGYKDIGEITVVKPLFHDRIVRRRAILRMHIGDKLRLIWDCRDSSKSAFLHTQQCSLTRWIGLTAVSLNNIALEHQVPRLSLWLLDSYYRSAGEVKIHPDVSGTRINSIDDRSYQPCANFLRLRRRGLVGG